MDSAAVSWTRLTDFHPCILDHEWTFLDLLRLRSGRLGAMFDVRVSRHGIETHDGVIARCGSNSVGLPRDFA
jgi:hypothetical protein